MSNRKRHQGNRVKEVCVYVSVCVFVCLCVCERVCVCVP